MRRVSSCKGAINFDNNAIPIPIPAQKYENLSKEKNPGYEDFFSFKTFEIQLHEMH